MSELKSPTKIQKLMNEISESKKLNDNILSCLIEFAKELKTLLSNGQALKAISVYTFTEREKGRNIPYLSILDKTVDGEVTGIYASPIAKQKELKAFFDEYAPGSGMPKYSFRITKEEGLVFTEKLGKGKNNFKSLI